MTLTTLIALFGENHPEVQILRARITANEAFLCPPDHPKTQNC